MILALTDSQQTIEQVVDCVLALDRAQTSTSFSMSSLESALPTHKETQFRQAIQCKTCLNSSHSAMDCALRPHCPICHSRAHTVEHYEYNMLNRTSIAPVHQIEPRHNRPRQDNRNRPPPRFPKNLLVDQVPHSVAKLIIALSKEYAWP